MKNIYGYARFNEGSQADRGVDIKWQKEQIQHYCDEKNMEVTRVCSDECPANDIDERTEFSKMVNEMQYGDTLVILNTSRLWRDEAMREFIVKMLKKKKVEVISIEQPRFEIV